MKPICKKFSINTNNCIKSLIYFSIGTLGLILLTTFSDKLSSLDKGLATWAKNLNQNGKNVFENGVILFCNKNQELVFIIALVIIVALVLYDLIIARIPFKTHKFEYLYILLQVFMFVLFSSVMIQIMKFYFDRPRPRHTIDMHPPGDTDLQCKLPFQKAFTRYYGPNPCDYSLESCPSGHVQGVATACIILLWIAIYNYNFTNKYTSIKKVNAVISICVILFSGCVTAVLIPSVMISRIVASAHYFTDVMGGLLVTILSMFVLPLFEPSFDKQERSEYQSVHQVQMKSAKEFETVSFNRKDQQEKLLDAWHE
ncbi:PAP2_superfamily protein [Hexamita inflata]|uniref:PAP2 superfamily protein n=1 Tax=Hexamita inflata TaxID=28002 RepID=A0AA86PHY3_9EUKA|nr:PAP2 superfamily protein [Hexamita inflata]